MNWATPKLTKEDEILLDYLDGSLPEIERKSLEVKINQSEHLQTRLLELKALDNLLRQREQLEQPAKNFTFKVMQHLNAYPLTDRQISKRGVFLLIGILVAIGAASFLLAKGSYDNMNGNLVLNSLPRPKNIIEMPTVHLKGKWIVNAILLAASGISLMVLDRIVLRPFFTHRASVGK